jgi:hypothetical protein
MDIWSAVAIIISLSAFIFSVCQFFSERNRNRREATIHAFDELQESVFSLEEYKKLPIRDGSEFAMHPKDESNIKSWNKATLALSKIEHFAVGVNTKIYDAKTLNRMAGGFIINEYSRWIPIINTKREQSPEVKHYDEFEAMVKMLKKLRKEKAD